jgi:YgiT-type zinc finger domain-containing protein
MSSENKEEKLVKKEVTYTLLKDEQFFIVENVPARVNVETGEEYFSPKTVEHLHKIILEQDKPVRTIKTPVYNFA